jgi:hypothetical protein
MPVGESRNTGGSDWATLAGEMCEACADAVETDLLWVADCAGTPERSFAAVAADGEGFASAAAVDTEMSLCRDARTVGYVAVDDGDGGGYYKVVSGSISELSRFLDRLVAGYVYDRNGTGRYYSVDWLAEVL